MQLEPYASWEKKASYTFRAAWLSKKDRRRHFAQELSLELLSQNKDVPLALQLELSNDFEHLKREDWHHLFIIDSMRMLDSFKALKQDAKSFLKKSSFDAGHWETLFQDVACPVHVSKSRRVKLLDKFLKGIQNYSFSNTDNFYELIESFDDYAMVLSVEYANFRRFIDGEFKDSDNPIKSLAGIDCKVSELAFDAEKEEPRLVAQGQLELLANKVRIADWEHSFDDADEFFECVPYLEVNFASEELKKCFYFEVLDRSIEEDE